MVFVRINSTRVIAATNMPTIAGCGKTVLSSKIIETLFERKAEGIEMCIAFFYFDFRDQKKQSVDRCLRSLLRQLAGNITQNRIVDLYEQYHGHGRDPNIVDLLNILQEVLRPGNATDSLDDLDVRKEPPPTFLVLDALDECSDVKKLMKTIRAIHEWELPFLRILATSREEEEIRTAMTDMATHICLKPELVDRDIETFVAQTFDGDGLLAKWSDKTEVRDVIETKLPAMSKGM